VFVSNQVWGAKMKNFFFLLVFSIFLLGTVFWVKPYQTQITNYYPPTEISHDHNEEKASYKRKQWLREIHKVRPGTDWKKLETEQWNKQLLKRNSFANVRKSISNWTEQGSIDVAGRTHHVILSGDKSHIYIGTNGGGVWKGKFDTAVLVPEDMEWQPLGDNVMGGALQIAILHTEGKDTIVKSWDNTVHYSTDEGVTWHASKGMEMSSYQAVRRFLTFTGDNSTVLATISGWEQVNGSWVYKNYLFKSTDGGATFEKIRDFGDFGGDIWTSRVESGPLYMFTEKTMYISTDKGETFDIVGSFSDTDETDVILAGSEVGAPTFYVARKQNNTWNLYKSEDGGISWEFKNTITENYFGMNSFFRGFNASIVNSDLILYGGVEGYRSEDGGTTFTRINTWDSYYSDNANRLHADIPAFDVILLPDNTERWYISTDGGTYVSDDGCQTVHNITLLGMRNSQYYSTLTDRFDENNVQAGAQDQGYQYSTNALSGNANFKQIFSGDYGQLTSSDGGHSTVYSVYPGFIAIVKKSGGTIRQYSRVTFPSDVKYAAWLPMVVADPDDENTVYFCASNIIKYKRQNAASTYWIRYNLPFDFSNSENGDGNDYVSCLGISPANHNYWYAGTAQGKFYYSTDRGETWTEGQAIEPRPHYLYSLAVLCDENDPLTVTIAGSGYDNAAVWRSTDGGQTFSALGLNQPQCIVLDLAASPDKNGDIYAATTIGPYRYSVEYNSWVSILESNAPMTEYWSVETLSDRIRFGTYGRGIWDYTPANTDTMNNVFVIPHIDWSKQWSSKLIIDNLNNESTTVRVVLYKNSSVVSDKYFSVSANNSQTVNLDNGTCGIVYASDNVMFREAFVHNLEKGIAEFSLSKEPSANELEIHFLMPAYLANDLTWMGIALFNPHNEVVTATLTAYNLNGEITGNVTFDIQPYSRSVGLVETYFPELTLNDVARIKAVSSKPLTGINISGNSNEQLLFTKTVCTAELDSVLNVSHIANEWDYWNNRLVFDNLSSSEKGEITVTLYKSGGELADEFNLTVDENGVYILNLNDNMETSPESGTITITSGTVAVRQSYQSTVEKGTAEFVLNGNRATMLHFVFPSYSTDILDWFGMSVFNPTENSREVTLSGYWQGDSVGSVILTIPAKSRFAFLTSQYFSSQVSRVDVSASSDITGINISGSGHKRLLFTHAVNN
jgi:photosystem II stability/assembly factor-like uncharacterized protein